MLEMLDFTFSTFVSGSRDSDSYSRSRFPYYMIITNYELYQSFEILFLDKHNYFISLWHDDRIVLYVSPWKMGETEIYCSFHLIIISPLVLNNIYWQITWGCYIYVKYCCRFGFVALILYFLICGLTVTREQLCQKCIIHWKTI